MLDLPPPARAQRTHMVVRQPAAGAETGMREVRPRGPSLNRPRDCERIAAFHIPLPGPVGRGGKGDSPRRPASQETGHVQRNAPSGVTARR